MKKALYCLFITLMLALTLPGCENEDFAVNAYKTLKSADLTYTATMQSVAKAQAAGIISAEQRIIINDSARIYLTAFRAAANALYTWQLSKSKDDQLAVMQGVSNCVQSVKELVVLVASNGVKTGGTNENK